MMPLRLIQKEFYSCDPPPTISAYFNFLCFMKMCSNGNFKRKYNFLFFLVDSNDFHMYQTYMMAIPPMILQNLK